MDARERAEIQEQIERVRERYQTGERRLLPLGVELGSLNDRVESLERDIKRALVWMRDDAQRALDTIESGEYEPSYPDTKRLDQLRAERDEKLKIMSSLARTAKYMLDTEEREA